MGKEQPTALVLRESSAEWTALRGGNGPDRLSVAGSGSFGLERSSGDGEADDSAAMPPSLAEQLRAGLSSDAHRVTVCVDTAQALLRVLRLPSDDPVELASMVRIQVDKFSPFPAESVVVSHEVLRRGGRASLVLAAVVPRSVVDLLGETLGEAGLRAERVDVCVLGWWRLLTDAGELSGRGREVVVILDRPEPELLVLQDGVPLVLRMVGNGVPRDQIAGELAADLTYTMMSLEIDHGSEPIGAAGVWFRGEAPDGLEEALSAACGCPVQMRPIEALPPLSEGLARRSLAGEERVLDLTPEAWRATEAARLFKKRMLGSVIGVVGLWALVMVGVLGSLRVRENGLARLRAEQQAWRDQALEVRALRERVLTVRRYMVRTYSALECFREVCGLQTDGVELNSITYRKGEGLKLGGTADTTDQVYEFKNGLEGSEIFSGTTLSGPQLDSKLRKWRFDIDIKLPGDES